MEKADELSLVKVDNRSPVDRDLAAPHLKSELSGTRPGTGRVLFLQPFGISDVGGGSRILRTLIQAAPVKCQSIVTSRTAPSPTGIVDEQHFPDVPSFGRLGRTRLNKFLQQSSFFWKPLARKRLHRLLRSLNPTAIHLVIQPGLDGLHLSQIAKQLKIRLAVSFHDHYRYFLQTGAYSKQNICEVRYAWQTADQRFVISSELGNSLAGEFGQNEFTVITDGVEGFPQAASPLPDGDPVIYFMGQFHPMYQENFNSLIKALGMLSESNNRRTKLRLRGRWIPQLPTHPLVDIERLPLGNDQDVANDLARSHVAYLPLPFEQEYRDFSAYSLSTKMITYLAAGRPVLYHGPADSAAGRLLQVEEAAFSHNSLETADFAKIIAEIIANREFSASRANRGLKLVRERFQCDRISQEFWSKLLASRSLH